MPDTTANYGFPMPIEGEEDWDTPLRESITQIDATLADKVSYQDVDAKGDLLVGTGPDALDRLAVGVDGEVLIADSAEVTGLKWSSAGGGTTITQQASAPSSPQPGDLWIDTDGVPLGSPVRGVLPSGYAQVTANQIGIGASDTDLTGLSVTVTVNSGERIRITGYVPTFLQSGSDGIVNLHIKEGATQLSTSAVSSYNGNYRPGRVEAILTPAPGSHTYKLAAKTSAGTMSMEAAATHPAFIMVEGVGT